MRRWTHGWTRQVMRWRRRLYGALTALYRVVFRSDASRGRLSPQNVRRMLIVRDDRIGDLIVTTPLLGFLRHVAPQAEVDLVCSRTNAVLVTDDDRVARVFIGGHTWWTRAALLRRLRARHYDVTFSVIAGNGLLEGVFASLVAGRRAARVSVWRPKRYHGFFTHVVRAPHSARRMAEQVLAVGAAAFEHRSGGAASPVDCARFPMRLRVADGARAVVSAFLASAAVEQFVVVNLWTAEPGREWSPESCAALLTRLSSRDASRVFVLTPPSGGEAIAGAVRRASPGSRVVIFPSRMQLPELVALVARARLAVTVNTSVVHIASACGRPVLGLYTRHAPDKNEHWLPLGVPYRVLFAPAAQPVSAIPLDDVAQAFEELSAALAGPPA